MSGATPVSSPYVGPRPFGSGAEDAARFYGRDREASELLSLVIAHPVVVLYAQSGAGKTSIINARLKPALLTRGSEVFGPARVSGLLPQGIAARDVKNIYTFNALLSLQPAADPKSLCQQTCAEFLAAQPHLESPAGFESSRVLIFDQFEEIFTTSPERWEERAGFFQGVAEALEKDRRLRVVFALREEYLAALDAHADALPERLRTRFRLERLRYAAALEALKRPLEGTGRKFREATATEEGTAEQLVKNLMRVPTKSASGKIESIEGEFVEPVQLQVVAQNLWQSLAPDVTVIDDRHVQDYGDVDKALSSYYEYCLKAVADESAQTEQPIKESRLRRWFGKKLITPDGVRGIVYQDETQTGGLPNVWAERFDKLLLVRKELRGGGYWFELTHDRFIEPIRASNAAYFKQLGTEEIVQTLQPRADKWAAERKEGFTLNERSVRGVALALADRWALRQKTTAGLLTGRELDEALHWLEGPAAQEMEIDENLHAYVQASAQARTTNQLRRRIAVMAIFLIIAVVLAGWGFWGWVSTRKAEQQAKDATLNAYGDIANTLAQQDELRFNALVLGIKAVAPSLKNNAPPTASALNGLRAATMKVADAIALRWHTEPINLAVFSPDGKFALTVSNDKLCMSDVNTGELLIRYENPKSEEEPQAGFSPDGRLLFFINQPQNSKAVTSVSQTVDNKTGVQPEQLKAPKLLVWDTQTRQPFAGLNEQSGVVNIQFSRDSKRALLWINDERAKPSVMHIVEPVSGKMLHTFLSPAKRGGLVFSPDGMSFVVIDSGGAALYDASNGKLRGALQGMEQKNRAAIYYSPHIAYSPDGKQLILWSGETGILPTLWDAAKGQKIRQFKSPLEDISRINFSRDGKYLILLGRSPGQAEEEVEIFELAADVPPTLYPLPNREFPRELDEMGHIKLETRAEERTMVTIWDALTRQAIVKFDVPENLESVELSADMRYIMGTDKNEARIWQIGQSAPDVAAMPPTQLVSFACERLRFQPELEQVKDFCPADATVTH